MNKPPADAHKVLLGLVFVAVILLLPGCGKKASSNAETTTPVGAWEGFRGIKWEAEVKAASNLVLLEDYGNGYAEYARKDEKLSMGEVKLKAVIYGFYKGRFAWATIVADSQGYKQAVSDNRAVHEILETRYGKQTDAWGGGVWNHGDISVHFFSYNFGGLTIPRTGFG